MADIDLISQHIANTHNFSNGLILLQEGFGKINKETYILYILRYCVKSFSRSISTCTKYNFVIFLKSLLEGYKAIRKIMCVCSNPTCPKKYPPTKKKIKTSEIANSNLS